MTPEQFEDIDLDVMEKDLNEFGRGIFDKKQIQQLIDYARYLRAGEKYGLKETTLDDDMLFIDYPEGHPNR